MNVSSSGGGLQVTNPITSSVKPVDYAAGPLAWLQMRAYSFYGRRMPFMDMYVWKPYLNVRNCAVQNGSHEPHVAVEPLERGSPERDVL